MRSFLLTISLIFIFSTGAIAQQPSAKEVLATAQAQAKKENKKVFVIFHASWCKWCKKMENNMQTPECTPLFDKSYVTTFLTVQESPKNKSLENPGADELLKTYKADKSGIPFWVILDANGKVLEDSFNAKGENLGCPADAAEVAEFTQMLKNTSKLTDRELAVIANTFIIKK
jgi:thioredoxin-related protein